MLGKVALTFDDGPNPPYTDQILDILKKENIKATFFVCGANIARHPHTLKRETMRGHTIGNHTYSHRYLPTRLGLINGEVAKTQELIEKLAPQKQKLFRSPYLSAPGWFKNKLQRKGFKIANEGIFGNDWETKTTPERIAKKIMSKVKDGTIIILHDGYNATEGTDRSKTVDALKIIIAGLKSKGFEFVPLNQL